MCSLTWTGGVTILLFVTGVRPVTVGRRTAQGVFSPGPMERGLRPVLHDSNRHGGDQQQRHLHAAHAHPVQSGQLSRDVNRICRSISIYVVMFPFRAAVFIRL